MRYRATAVAALLSVSCTTARPVASPPPPGSVVWEYDVSVADDAVLSVEATFRGPVDALQLDDDAAPFIDQLTRLDGSAWVPASATDAGWAARCASNCLVRYRVRLGAAAATLANVDSALSAGGAVFAPPSTWLVRPTNEPVGVRYRFRVTPAASFVTGVRAGERGYEADVATFDEAAFAVFGPARHLAVGPAVIAAAPGTRVSDAAITTWATTSLDAVTRYLGKPPAERVTLLVAPGTTPVMRGKTLAGGGPSLLVRVGTSIDDAALRDDWVLAHELIHVGFPRLDRAHAWFTEGLASYAEPVARAHVGLVTPEKFWDELIEGLPQGLPRPGDGGLDGTTETDRIYWGGSLWFLLADIAIREQTEGKRSLRDAVRGVVLPPDAGVEHTWPIARVLEAADAATGTRVFRELYDRHGVVVGPRVDLAALLTRLGVAKRDGRVVFDPKAPLARLREAITQNPR